MQYGFLTRGIQLEDYAGAARAAVARGAVKVARRIAEQASLRIRPVRPACEGIEQGLAAGCIQLKHDAGVPSAARAGNAEKIAGLVANQSARGRAFRRIGRETVQYGFAIRLRLHNCRRKCE